MIQSCYYDSVTGKRRNNQFDSNRVDLSTINLSRQLSHRPAAVAHVTRQTGLITATQSAQTNQLQLR